MNAIQKGVVVRQTDYLHTASKHHKRRQTTKMFREPTARISTCEKAELEKEKKADLELQINLLTQERGKIQQPRPIRL